MHAKHRLYLITIIRARSPYKCNTQWGRVPTFGICSVHCLVFSNKLLCLILCCFPLNFNLLVATVLMVSSLGWPPKPMCRGYVQLQEQMVRVLLGFSYSNSTSSARLHIFINIFFPSNFFYKIV